MQYYARHVKLFLIYIRLAAALIVFVFSRTNISKSQIQIVLSLQLHTHQHVQTHDQIYVSTMCYIRSECLSRRMPILFIHDIPFSMFTNGRDRIAPQKAGKCQMACLCMYVCVFVGKLTAAVVARAVSTLLYDFPNTIQTLFQKRS